MTLGNSATTTLTDSAALSASPRPGRSNVLRLSLPRVGAPSTPRPSGDRDGTYTTPTATTSRRRRRWSATSGTWSYIGGRGQRPESDADDPGEQVVVSAGAPSGSASPRPRAGRSTWSAKSCRRTSSAPRALASRHQHMLSQSNEARVIRRHIRARRAYVHDHVHELTGRSDRSTAVLDIVVRPRTVRVRILSPASGLGVLRSGQSVARRRSPAPTAPRGRVITCGPTATARWPAPASRTSTRDRRPTRSTADLGDGADREGER